MLYRPVVGQTIVPDHWLVDEIRYLQHRGRLWNLSLLQMPYDVGSLQAEQTEIDPVGLYLRRWNRQGGNDFLFTWNRFDQRFSSQADQSLNSTLRLGLGAAAAPGIKAVTSFYIDNQLDADSLYIGKRQGGWAAFTEQAYLSFKTGRFTFRLGRDYLVWGPGRDASLMISVSARPMDHFYGAWTHPNLQFSFFAAQLDQTNYPINAKPAQQNRFLSGHRIEWRPRQFLRVALSETALYGGPNSGFDLAFMNPLIFFTGEEHNGPQTANVMAMLDIVALAADQLTFYASFLLDDIQLERANVDDKGEPPEYGLTAGLNWADPLHLPGVDWFAEYTRVTNRTYNGQGGAWEKYLHRNVPIGHFLGNDFERMILGVSARPARTWRMSASWEHRRRGEGRVSKPFDTPWRDLPPGQKYVEPFPTGIVESAHFLNFSVRRYFGCLGFLEAQAAYRTVKQVENQIGIDDSGWEAALRLSLELLASHSMN
ncbi:MAG: capsule assembly Wzi family protein [candidate division KSB1 bacterium]|nr:capsule assembly Wzi family protein [candidate division KSB1 bacterium]